MLTDTELIRKLDFFEPLDQKIIKNIASLCIVREFAAGEAIVRQGESGLGLYFITGGGAKVEIDKDGSKVVVAELREGDFLGEFSIIDDKTRSASVICLQDTRCLLLTRDSFSKLLKKHPEIASQMLRTLVGRIRNTNERITQPVGTRPAEAPAPAVEEPVPSDGQRRGGFAETTSQIAAMIPKPEEMVQFYSSTKGKTQEFLNRFVSAIYAMKAMLRFSMAIVGCPVRVSAEHPNEEILEATLNDVKLVLFPAASEQTIRIDAAADGMVSATLYRPAGTEGDPRVEVFRLQGPVRQGDCLRVHVPIDKPIRMEPSWAISQEFAVSALPVHELSSASALDPWLITETRWQ
ncbi:MAG: cyclic nucleotide-binding domain-containing protein [Acidobacteria bacterium]|nr:cyclic nucleotide-binding domain-containing protein [Acidobacteriota bacterium]